MTVYDILNEETHNFEVADIPSARLDAEVLLSFCLNCDRLEFYKKPDMAISETKLAAFRKLIARRLQWEPVAYLTGRKEFWTFVLEVNSSVLIPRPDTEVIVEEALNICRKVDSSEIKILDIGTGSGAIAIALALEITGAKVMATDISETAVNLAKKNADTLGLKQKIDFRYGNLFEPVNGFFDIIICNPPYISAQDYEKLPAGVKNYRASRRPSSRKKRTGILRKIDISGGSFPAKKWLAFVGNWS